MALQRLHSKTLVFGFPFFVPTSRLKAYSRFRQKFMGRSWFLKLLGIGAVAELRINGNDAARECRWHDAARLYSRYLLEAPKDFGIWVQCGHARKETGDFDEAERCYLTALKLRSSDADLHLQLGHLYKLMGRSVDAREFYVKSHELDPSLGDARKELEALGWADETGRVAKPDMVKDRDFQQHLALVFDPEWYIKTYSEKFGFGKLTRESAMAHYQTVGCQQGASPVPDFDEEFYCAFYNDIRRAKQLGWVKSGYHHFVVAGRTEGRLGRYDVKSTLEAVMPGLTMPNAFARVHNLREIVRIPDVLNKQTAKRSLFAICPRLNPDIAFGGYKAFFELILSMGRWLRPHGIDIEIIVTEESAESVVYAVYHIGVSPIGQFLSSVPVWDFRNNLPEVGPHDRFLCYSAKDTFIGARLARRTDQPRVLSLIQEDEAIFHPFNYYHATVSDALAASVFPIFNSHFLVRHMRMSRRSIFRDVPDAEEGLHYCVFEHVLTKVPRQTRKQMSERTVRNCVVYARPEDHAARNLYEIAEVALSNVCAASHFVLLAQLGRCAGAEAMPTTDESRPENSAPALENKRGGTMPSR